MSPGFFVRLLWQYMPKLAKYMAENGWFGLPDLTEGRLPTEQDEELRRRVAEAQSRLQPRATAEPPVTARGDFPTHPKPPALVDTLAKDARNLIRLYEAICADLAEPDSESVSRIADLERDEARSHESKIRAWNLVTGILIGLVIYGLGQALFG